MNITSVIAKVGLNNHSAMKFFQTKKRFEQVGIISMIIIKNPLKNDSVTQLSTDKAIELTSKFYEEKDMRPLEYKGIFDSPAYIGTYIIHKGDEFVAASLWNISYYGEVEISKVIIDAKYLKNNFIHFLIQIALLAVIFLYLLVWYLLYEYFEERSIKITLFSAAALLMIFAMKSYFTLIKYIRQSRMKFKPRVKIFGVFYSTTIENKKDVFFKLLDHMAAIDDYEYCSFEFHEEDVYFNMFQNEDFCRAYLQKNLDKTKPFTLNKRMFIDPRD